MVYPWKWVSKAGSFQIKMTHGMEFPGSLAIKDSTLSLLWLRFELWPRNSHKPQAWEKKKKKGRWVVGAWSDVWAEDEHFKGICMILIFQDLRVDSFLRGDNKTKNQEPRIISLYWKPVWHVSMWSKNQKLVLAQDHVHEKLILRTTLVWITRINESPDFPLITS